MKVRVPTTSGLARFVLGPVGRTLVISGAVITILGFGVFTYFYLVYAPLIDQKLRDGPIANTAKIFAAPAAVWLGDTSTPEAVAADLRRSGYTESRSNPTGYYQLYPTAIEVYPGPDSYFDQEAGLIRFAGGKISGIVSLQDNTSRNEYQLEPQLITNFSGPNREKRRTVRFADIPKVLVEAVTSAEDKRFFQHSGFDPVRILKAAYVDVREGRKDQGASTLSMQLAKMFWLDPQKKWTRKLAQVMITIQIEQRMSKEEIFEDYANDVYLGSRGSFRIHGFGEAAEAYLGKDLSQIDVSDAAELAGMIQHPAAYDPYHHPDRVRERRNVVLSLMRQNGYIDDRDYAKACEAPINVPKTAAQSTEAPYFVDLVTDTLQSKFQDTDLQANAYRIYTTLDMRLQREAGEAVRMGMQNVDEQIRKQRRFKGQPVPEPQVALVAIDPHTGEVRALVGGRSYGVSQLNHVLAKRQPGSIFKPFVYATAMDTAVDGGPEVLTASSIVDDEPTTFWFDNRKYEPSNFEHEFMGQVTLRTALAHSLNVATVKVAETVGYGAVVRMAGRAGLTGMQPTPAVALGSYEVTPLDAAGAYTMFANQGVFVKPSFLTLVRSQDGHVLYKGTQEKRAALDPRVAYLMTNLMEEVLRSGTGAGVRGQYHFFVPAAGKTGTSHDGWFAGYTTQLLCVVWVGFDDNLNLDLQGAFSAAPIWAEFMRRALSYREYRDAAEFQVPNGIVTQEIDPASGMPATPNCPKTQTEVYIAGTEPVGSCPLHGGRGGATNVAGWDSETPARAGESGLASGASQIGAGEVARRASRQTAPDPATQTANTPAQQDPRKTQEKKGLLRRLLDVIK